MKRQIVLDTETTGLKVEDGERVIEIGCVELINNVKTGKTFHIYLNPDRDSQPKALEVHGLTREFLSDKPRFKDIADDFIAFIKGAELVIHNSKFDVGFLNSELEKIEKGKVWDYVPNVICTLILDKQLYSEERKHNLDAMCLRHSIDTSARTLHGALLDADLLADVFIQMNIKFPKEDIEADLEQKNWQRAAVKRYEISLPTVSISENEAQLNAVYLEELGKKEKLVPVFSRNFSPKP